MRQRPASLVAFSLALGACADAVWVSSGTDGVGGATAGSSASSSGATTSSTTSSSGSAGASSIGTSFGATTSSTSSSRGCIDLMTDTANCGSCGHDCLGGTCQTGACQPVVLASGVAWPIGIAVDAANVYWGFQGGAGNSPDPGGVMKIPVGGGAPTLILSQPPPPRVFDITVDATRVYWMTEGPGGAVLTMPLAGGGWTTLASALSSPVSIAVDGDSAYWTTIGAEIGDGSVMKVPIAGGPATMLASTQTLPRGIVVDATSVYWAVETGVMKVPIGGGAPATLASIPPTSRLAIGGSSLYFSAAIGSGALLRVPVGGGAPAMLASAPMCPAAIAVDAENVYWVNYGCGGGVDGTVMKLPIGGGSPAVIASGQFSPLNIALDDKSIYWTTFNGGTVMKLAK